MKIVLLGPNGQLGTDIRAEFERLGRDYEIVPIARDKIDVSHVDEAIDLLSSIPFEAVINTTAYHKTDEVEGNAQLAFTVNAHFVRRLAELCGDRKARLVHISTDYVFGGQTKRAPLTEEDGKAPINVYGASKSVGEDLALTSGADVLVLRVSALFGRAGASGKGGNFVETMLRVGKAVGVLKVVDDQITIPTATSDVAESIAKIFEHDVQKGCYHAVNSGEPVSWHEFAVRIIEISGIQADVVPISTDRAKSAAARPEYSALSNARLASWIGEIRPWREALGSYMRARDGSL